MDPTNSVGFGLGSTSGGRVSDAGTRTVSGQKKTFFTASVSCGELLWGVHVKSPAHFARLTSQRGQRVPRETGSNKKLSVWLSCITKLFCS